MSCFSNAYVVMESSNVAAVVAEDARTDNDSIRPQSTRAMSRQASITGESMVSVYERRPLFYPFTQESEIYFNEERTRRRADMTRKRKPKEAKLVDGELKYDDAEEDSQEDKSPRGNPMLVEGAPLPTELGTFPKDLYGCPIEEIDPLVRDETFVVVSKRLRSDLIFRFSSAKSLFFLHGYSRLRRVALRIATNQFFDYLIICCILANCVYLTFTDPQTEVPEIVFLTIYTFEMIVRIIARGFVLSKHTYLRDPWNWLDFIVVVTSYVTIILENLDVQGAQLSGLRTFRVLRALKTISIVPGLRTIVNALSKSLKMLAEVMALTFFCMSIYALFGLQVYMGSLRQKCVPTHVNEINANITSDYETWWNYVSVTSSLWVIDLEDPEKDFLVCGNSTGAQPCPPGYQCMRDIDGNPNWGYTNFDTFGWSLLTSFQLVTLDFWEDPYNKIISAGGPWNVIFFMCVVFFGSFYLINLMLAVVALSYDEEAAVARTKKGGGELEFDTSKLRLVRKMKKRSELSGLSRGPSARSMQSRKLEQNGSHGIERRNGSAQSNRNTVNMGIGVSEKRDNFAKQVTISQDTGIEVRYSSMSKREQTSETLNSDSGVIIANSHNAESRPGDRRRLSSRRQTVFVIVADEETEEEYALADRNCACCSKNCCTRCGDYRQWLEFQNNLHWLVSDPFVEIFVMICILLNTLAMAMEYHGMSLKLQTSLEIANYIFTGIFLLEALLKLLSMSKRYFQIYWNIFDFVIVIASLVDVIITLVMDNAAFGVSVIRSFRLIRVFRLAHSWKTMRLLLSIILTTLGALGNLTIVLVIIAYMFAVMGMQLFHKDYTVEKFGGPVPRWNFTDFWHSFMMIFRVLCGEWIEPLWDCMRVAGEGCVAVFIPALVLGNFMVLNLFLALLLTAFASDSLKSRTSKDDTVHRDDARMRQRLKAMKSWFRCCFPSISPVADGASSIPSNSQTNSQESKRSNPGMTDVYHGSLEPREVPHCCPTICYKKISCCRGCASFDDWPRWHAFRMLVLQIVDHKIFETVILILIMLSSAALCFEDVYLPEKPWLRKALKVSNYVFVTLFIMEMLLKWVAFGLKEYFTSFWTLLDFVIVCVSCVSIVAEEMGLAGLGSFRSLRTLRALRPLRAISRWQGMKLVVSALMHSIPAIFNVMLVILVFWLIFSIMGVQFFGGKFGKCVDSEGEKLDPSIIRNEAECHKYGNYTWITSHINFDNVFSGYLSLFQVATFEGWMEIMEDAIDSPDVTHDQPSFENSPGYYIYFVVFIIIGAFFTLNLFIGVIIDNFNQLKAKYEGNYLDIFLTDSQKQFYATMKKLGNQKPRKTTKRPTGWCHSVLYDLAISTRFEILIMFMIICNAGAMAVHSYNQSEKTTAILRYFSILFTTFFTLEAALKIAGLGLDYFRRTWNVFDFFIVVLSIVGTIIEDLLTDSFFAPSLLRVLRVLRIGRLIRLIRSAKGIRKLLFALMVSLPALFNIAALLFLIIFIYAIIGMSTFGNVKKSNQLTETMNFETFGSSVVLLFRLATAAGWNDVLDPLLVQPPNCNATHISMKNGTRMESPNGDCGLPLFASIYFVTFVMITFLVIINMYIAVILENFSQAHEQEEVGITHDDIEMFYVVWEKYDPLATQFINVALLSDFVAEVEKPLGIEKPNDILLVGFDLPISKDDMVHCLDILMALIKHALGGVEETGDFADVKRNMEQKFEREFPNRVKVQTVSSTLQRKKEDIAAKTLQRCWRKHKLQSVMRNITTLAMTQISEEENSSEPDPLPSPGPSTPSTKFSINKGIEKIGGFFKRRASDNDMSPRSTDRAESRTKQFVFGSTLEVPR